MTPTKRMHEYKMDERPQPGDIVQMPSQTTLWREPGKPTLPFRRIDGQRALVLGVCGSTRRYNDLHWFDWLLVLTVNEARVGWVPNQRMLPLIPRRGA